MRITKRFIGDRKFYRMLFQIALPILIQNGITNFVNMLDNVMVGQTGTEQMSGVAVTNQLIFVFNICIFGIVSGAGIFGAQFYGSKNEEGFRNTFRFKMVYCAVASLIGTLIFAAFGEGLISQFLHEGGSGGGDLQATLLYGKEYLLIMLAGLLPFAVSQVYASTLREMGKTMLPMVAGVLAIVVNIVFNYILIFGKFGAPALGVAGAAIATVLSRFAEAILIIVIVERNKEEYPFARGAYRKLWVPMELQKKIFLKGSPLILNEVLWAAGMAVLNQSYSVRGLVVVAGINISSTVSNVFSVFYLTLGSVVSIIIGQLLGAGKMEEAKDQDVKLIAASVLGSAAIGLAMIGAAPLFPRIYNTTEEVRGLAAGFITILAMIMPVQSFINCCYFTLRSGGKTVVTLLFDSVFVWVVSIPLARVLTGMTPLPITTIFFCVQAAELIKAVIGFVLLKKGVWLNNFVSE